MTILPQAPSTTTYPNAIVQITRNKKLGIGVATSNRPVGDAAKGEGTCPSNCALLLSGACYAKKGRTNIHQMGSRKRTDNLDKFLAEGCKLIRLHVSGDFFTSDGEGGYMIDMTYLTELLEWVAAHPKVTVWTYCHDIAQFIKIGYTPNSGKLPSNFHLVASCDSVVDRYVAKSYGFKTARVIKEKSEKAEGEVFCPHDYQIREKMPKRTTCAECRLCYNGGSKDIAFLIH